MPLELAFAEATATGPRKENQDALRSVQPSAALAATKGHLFALADGVSGCPDGGLAARATLQALAQDYYSTPETWPVAQALERLLLAQNRWLQAAGNGQPLLTTLTALVIRGRRYTLAHVGDCRAYRWHGDRLSCLTVDHVWQQAGMQHVLTRALGLENHLVVDFREGELEAGETLLLVSDGVWAALGEDSMRRILVDGVAELEATAQALVAGALHAGGQDNASALLVRVDRLPDVSLADTLASADTWPPLPALKPGQHFEGWTVVERLAESRQSLLYRVKDEGGRPWLLKTLPAALQCDTLAGHALLMEEWFLRRVAGRAFVEVHPLPRRAHLYFVQREYAGRTLAQQLRSEGPLALADWLDVASRLLRALGQLHRRNILHRDIKPDNLHRGQDGELRLLDFGLAYCPQLSEDLHDSPGTPSYRAPESFEGAEPSPAQDLYATGVTLYQLLTGGYPYGEVEPFQRPRFGAPASALRRRPDVPAWLDDWLQRAVAVDPADRFETAEEALLLLEQGERQPLARPLPLLQRDPLRTWQIVAACSLLLNLLLVLLWLYRH
ncbi:MULTISPECIES: bifunctional protein-serine/threonine kinase/phosphatase [Pseudomonas]|uniref:bifunctional protein-serine/threonine kinase/phosphatase n=1 Tax=Pseudomonas TaxID=286 RepID=UPI00105F432B|nr:bifunctional protein-serine/threonine kinase/phosphatase [Pseudomonas oryzihabitans]MDK8263230.1 bifunctional protein-serine/threonine kinase/phosphatase [Pseudomonas oryzihabitans]